MELYGAITDFVAQSNCWAWETDSKLRHVYISENFETLTGQSRKEMLGRDRRQTLSRHLDAAAVEAHWQDLKARRPFRGLRYQLRDVADGPRWVETNGTPFFDAEGRFLGYRGIARYVTADILFSEQLAEADREIRISETVFSQVERIAKIGAWRLDLGSGRLDWSSEVFNICELDHDTPITVDLAFAPFHPEDRERLQAAVAESSTTGAPFDLILSFTTVKGNFRWVRVLGEAECVEGRPVKLFGTFQDVTDESSRQYELRRLAETDHLTGIANRAAFQGLAQAALDRAIAEDCIGALCLIDLDRFKEINDHFGHAAGDSFLQETTSWLLSLADGLEGAQVARLGGDEFAFLFTGSFGVERLDAIIYERFSELQRKMVFMGRVLEIGASVGFVVFPRDGENLDELMTNADLALYDAKSGGRRKISKYQPRFGSAFTRKMDLIGEFRTALANNEIVPYYQPIVELATGCLSGFESLARWNHPTKGVLAAGTFADVFEDPELVGDIGDLMVRAITADMGRWKAQHLKFGRVGVNVTDTNLMEPCFALTLSTLLARHHLLPSHLVLEITENTVYRAKEAILQSLGNLKTLGVTIALDDFGTGYSSLTHLQDIPFDILKIDKSFTRGIHVSVAGREIARALVGLGAALGYTTVAEGIETEQERQFLAELGCERGQGFLFARPMPASEVPGFIASVETVEDRRELLQALAAL